jgi:hypothetical protein
MSVFAQIAAGREQAMSAMIKTASAITVAAIAAACFVVFPSLSPQVDAARPHRAPRVIAPTSRRSAPTAARKLGLISMPPVCMRDARSACLLVTKGILVMTKDAPIIPITGSQSQH